MTNFSKVSTKELIIYKETLQLRSDEFLKEIEEISQELIIRQMPECRPLCDIFGEGA